MHILTVLTFQFPKHFMEDLRLVSVGVQGQHGVLIKSDQFLDLLHLRGREGEREGGREGGEGGREGGRDGWREGIKGGN